MTQDEQRRQRRRRRATAVAGPPQPSPATSEPTAAAAPDPPAAPKKAKAKAKPAAARRDPGERGLRDLVGPGSSQLGVSRALRARDVNRPTEADLAEAAADLRVVRRNWRPQS